jgi:orotate phosphoribosyltransferase
LIISRKNQLRNLIIQHSYEQKEIVLSSGKTSNYYFDLKKTTHIQSAKPLIGNLFIEIMLKNNIIPKAVGGLTMGADPISCAISQTALEKYDNLFIDSFSIRKEQKKHGSKNQIEGCVAEGDFVIVIEDVVTSGGSAIQAINACVKNNLNVLACIALIDRNEDNGRQNIESVGVPFYSLYSIKDFSQ